MIPEIRRKFGKKIYQLRTKKGWTQEELAEYADIAVRHVQRLEGKTPSPVKIDTIEKLAKAFQIKCSRLLDF
jgi:transcriptional regulator with XRE-family HTH domain